IPFAANIIYPEQYQLRVVGAAPGAHAEAGKTVRYSVLLSRSGSGNGSLRTLRFSLTNDDDLLSLEDATGLHLDSLRGQDGRAKPNGRTTRYYTLSPIPASDTVSTLT